MDSKYNLATYLRHNVSYIILGSHYTGLKQIVINYLLCMCMCIAIVLYCIEFIL